MSKQGEPARISVLFVPYAAGNPYQELLIESLSKHGVDVRVHKSYRRFPLLNSIRDSNKPDILHLHWTTPFWRHERSWLNLLTTARFIVELQIVRLLGIKIVWTVHNLHAHDSESPELEHRRNRLYCRSYDQIIVHSEAAFNLVRETFRLSQDLISKISVTGHGHFQDSYENQIRPEEARRRLGLENGQPVFLFFGRIHPYKGIDQLIAAFQKLNHPSAQLLIVGKPENTTLREELLRLGGQHPRIRFHLEHVLDADVQIYLNAANAMVLPFQEVLTSSTVILGMSFGRAIIAPSLGCLTEVLDRNGAIYYSEQEEEGLLKSLRCALDADLSAMGRYNLERSRSFDWNTIGEQTYQVYNRCVHGR